MSTAEFVSLNNFSTPNYETGVCVTDRQPRDIAGSRLCY